MPHYRLTLVPDYEGGFKPDSFHHLLQTAVMAPGLDPGHEHRLIDAQVAEDGNSAELTVHSAPRIRTRRLDMAFRVVNGTPTAKVRCYLNENPQQLLIELQLDAPLQAGKRVALGEQEYLVMREEWPHRNPETLVCSGGFDWQYAYLSPVDPESSMPQLAALYATPPAAPPVLPPAAG